ncbi:major facilitator superfamily domain-containing protein [Lactifluus volemus]|nr:major facilitator superfamily domain-containing protein [Lactifluus volemus]
MTTGSPRPFPTFSSQRPPHFIAAAVVPNAHISLGLQLLRRGIPITTGPWRDLQFQLEMQQLFHVKVCAIAGTGFFTDAYDVFAINQASVMLRYVYGHTIGRESQLSHHQDFGIEMASPVGNLLGQLLFGRLADLVGRKRMYGIELIIIVTATFAQALAGTGPAVNIVGVIAVYRFIMGVGIGGDYPLSAVITSEFASRRTRGHLMTGVFTSQGWGNFAASLVALVVVVAFKPSIIADSFENPNHVDYCWRIFIGLGYIPGPLVLYFWLTIPETPKFTMDIDRDVRGPGLTSTMCSMKVPTSEFTGLTQMQWSNVFNYAAEAVGTSYGILDSGALIASRWSCLLVVRHRCNVCWLRDLMSSRVR